MFVFSNFGREFKECFRLTNFLLEFQKMFPFWEKLFLISKNVPAFIKEISFSKEIRQFEKCLHWQNTQFFLKKSFKILKIIRFCSIGLFLKMDTANLAVSRTRSVGGSAWSVAWGTRFDSQLALFFVVLQYKFTGSHGPAWSEIAYAKRRHFDAESGV